MPSVSCYCRQVLCQLPVRMLCQLLVSKSGSSSNTSSLLQLGVCCKVAMFLVLLVFIELLEVCNQ